MSNFIGEETDQGCGCLLVVIAVLLMSFGPGIAKALIAYLERGGEALR